MDIKHKLYSFVNQFVAGMLPIFLYTVLSIFLNGDKIDYSSQFTITLVAVFAVYVCASLV